MKLSVVIPVYNEINTIKQIIRKVQNVPLKKEIIIVDDGSTDGTKEFLSGRKDLGLKILFHKKNLGKGAALKTGFKSATGDVLIIQDADLEYDPRDYLKLLLPIQNQGAKVVYGSRLKTLQFSLSGKNKTPLPLHYLANTLLSFLTNIIYQTNLTDMETGYKMLVKEVYRKIKIQESGFAVEPEITARVVNLGHEIIEVPIKTKPRTYRDGKKITLADAFRAVGVLVKYKLVK